MILRSSILRRRTFRLLASSHSRESRWYEIGVLLHHWQVFESLDVRRAAAKWLGIGYLMLSRNENGE
jgi:hypothetical protein